MGSWLVYMLPKGLPLLLLFVSIYVIDSLSLLAPTHALDSQFFQLV